MGKPKTSSGEEGRRKYSATPTPAPAPVEDDNDEEVAAATAPSETTVHTHHEHSHHHHGHGHHHHHHHHHHSHSHSMHPHHSHSHNAVFHSGTSESSQNLHHRSAHHRVGYDYVMNISQTKGRELLLKNKIQTIEVHSKRTSTGARRSDGRKLAGYELQSQSLLAPSVSASQSQSLWSTRPEFGAGAGAGIDESMSTVAGIPHRDEPPEPEAAKIRTIGYHTRLASLYGPIPEHERVKMQQAQIERPAPAPAPGLRRSTSLVPSMAETEAGSTTATTTEVDRQSKSVRSSKFSEGGDFDKGCTGWIQRTCAQLSDISEDDRLDAIGEWDYWKGYYCGEQSTNKAYKHESLSWAIMFVLGQCGFMELVHYVHKWGSSFLVIAFLFYLTLGYAMYIFESWSGQYSGRKPLQAIRYLCPSLSGLGVLMYLRTILLTIRAMGIFLYATYFALHFLSCRIDSNEVLKVFHNQTQQKAPFPVGEFTLLKITNVANVIIIMVILMSMLVFGFKTLTEFGGFFRITTRILTVIKILYFIIIWTRYMDAKSIKRRKRQLIKWSTYNITRKLDSGYDSAQIWQPALDFFEFRPISLVEGRIWIDAIVYVVTSLALGTLVHPYLNSRSGFHYRSGRDGFLVVLYSLFMNYLTLGSVVLWITYIAPNKQQITAALQNLSGPYGILIVFAMQHHQAQHTGKMETDILFWAGIFYAALGLSAYLSVNGYIHVLVHCSYQERTSAGVKLTIYAVVTAFFLFALPILLFCREGMQYLVFLDFYSSRSIVLIVFTTGAHFWAVAYGHGLHKFVYDFRNMMHFEMFKAEHVSAHYSKYIRFVISVALGATLAYAAFLEQVPVAGNTDYGGTPAAVATGVAWLLCGLVLLGAAWVNWDLVGYTGRGRGRGLRSVNDNNNVNVNAKKRPFRPHRDWFKNPFHYKSCFIKAGAEAEAETETEHKPEETKAGKEKTGTGDLTTRRRTTTVSFKEMKA